MGSYRVLEGPFGRNSAFGDVYSAEDLSKSTPHVALKVSKRSDADSSTRFQLENDLLHKLSPHANVVAAYTAILHDTTTNLSFYCMELANSTIDEYIVKNADISSKDRFDIFKQICLGIKHAHSNNVVHRDLHNGNILVFEQGGEFPAMKLTDFGRAKDFDNPDSDYEPGSIWGRWDTCAPESFFRLWSDATPLSYKLSSDVYSLGVLLPLLFGVDLGAFLLTRQYSIASHFLANSIGNVSDIRVPLIRDNLSIAQREQAYEEWLQSYNHSEGIKAAIPVLNSESDSLLAEKIVKGCCHPDYRKRFQSVDDILNEVENA